jgi:glycerol-3-phosphate acyltransferase PlsY
MSAALALLGAYLLGSIPFSYLVARRFGVSDVRRVGSGNVGATNVMRSAGPAAGVLALLLDAGKGALAVVAVQRLEPAGWLPPLAALLAVLGHVFPPWLGFRGGKGVATGVGAFLPLAPLATAIALGVFLVSLAAFRYVSLASILGALGLASAAPVLGATRGTVVCLWVAALLIVVKHRENLERLRAGRERRLGARPVEPPA